MNKRHLCWKWGEQASDDELEFAAKGLIAANDSKTQLAHLWIFARRRFPLGVQALVPLAFVEEDRVGWTAMKALSHIVHPDVRALVFRMMDIRVKWRGEGIDLIAQNFESGDHSIILRWFEEEPDDQERHSMGMDLLNFWKRHPDEATEVPMLRALYEYGPCSFCRESAVHRLIERGALPDDLRAECAWDANDKIRKLVQEPGSSGPGPEPLR